MTSPSLRTLATRLSLSRATVSAALRGSPLVKESTRIRVSAEAALIGYRLNPIASELMARMRRSRGHVFRGLIALVAPEPDDTLPAPRRRRRELLREGAGRRAGELGFKIDPITGGEAWERLPNLLDARGSVGAIVLPSERCTFEHRARLALAERSVVCVGMPEEGAEQVDAIAPDYRQALRLAGTRLARLGYRRPGLVLSAREDQAELSQWRAAFEALRAAAPIVSGWEETPAPLVAPDISSEALKRWCGENGVDVLAGLDGELQAPRDTPFFLLDATAEKSRRAGLDLRWTDIGARTVELLARRYFDGLNGGRESPALISLPALWVEPRSEAGHAAIRG